MSSQMSHTNSILPTHSYHLVDASPWPAFTSFSVFITALGGVMYFHQYPSAGTVRVFGRLFRIFCASRWWRDVFRESDLGYHTGRVQRGLHYGMLWFIVSEAMFFFGLIWAFMHAALMPTVHIAGVWPPEGIVPVDWAGRPALNTVRLAASYFSANIAKYAMDAGRIRLCRTHLQITVLLGRLFLYYQYCEYSTAAFTFSDSVFGCNFYLATGFHGFHVLIGVLFLTVSLIRLNELTPANCLSLKLSVRYWHFVDRVWVGIYGIIYFWGSYTAPVSWESCTGSDCVRFEVLQDAAGDLYKHDSNFPLDLKA